MRPLPLAVLAPLCACVLWFASLPARAGEPDGESESGPELILPGDHVVQPGEWIELRWTRADQISELEILLSRDGGRNYSVCISPQLDPGLCRFRWRVPESGGDLRMRIRFNRNGREIEGAPTGPLRVAAGETDRPQPLGLPPVGGRGAAREPRPAGERSQSRPTPGVIGPRDAASPDRAHASARAIVSRPDPGTSPPDTADLMPFSAPRSLPLRS